MDLKLPINFIQIVLYYLIYLQRPATPRKKRLMINFNCLKCAYERRLSKDVFYIRGKLNPANALTKHVKKLYLFKTLENAKLDHSVEQ